MTHQNSIILFHTTSAAFRAEKVAKTSGIECRLIPTPRDLSSDCGVAMEVEERFLSDLKAKLDSSGVQIAGIHKYRTSSS